VNFDISDDAKALAEQAKRLFAEKAGPAKARAAMAKDAPAFDAALWKEVAELGWTAARVPEAHGGLGLTAEEAAVLAEAAGHALAVVPLTSTLLATEALIVAGSEAQQAKWLPGIASGETIAVVAWSEPGAATPSTMRVAAGGAALSGVKQPVADLIGAHLAIVAATGPDGPSFHLVDLTGPGVAVEAVETLDLVRRHGKLTLNNAPAEAMGTAGQY
jgi:acyl-CoA dehydrogenase